MNSAVMSPSPYSILSDALEILWRNDDILFEGDYREALAKINELKGVVIGVDKILDILNRAEDDILSQDDLFEVQDELLKLTSIFARDEHQWRNFQERFPWLVK